MDRPLLQITDLETRFSVYGGTAYVLDRVSLTVRPGELLGLVGETGCGKSVTGLSVLRLLPKNGSVVGGSVLYEGEELTAKPERELQRIRGGRISMIFQHPQSSLNPVFTIGAQLSAALRSHRRVGKRQGREIAVSLLSRVGLPDPRELLQRYPHELSGGMQQRVMIAIALSCAPALLIADEPTTALDVTIQAQILSLIRRLQEETSMAVLLITHNLGVVARVCDRLAVMYAGQIVEQAPVGAVFAGALHPYTRGLLGSLPGLETRGPLVPIPGNICSLTKPPGGCRFHPRCNAAMPICREQRPRGIVTAEGHTVCCHLYTSRRQDGESPAGS